MKTKLSYSAVEKYKACGVMYKLHYLDRIRPTSKSGALVFGAALDNAINELLIPTGKDSEKVFDEEFTYNKDSNKKIYIPINSDLVYTNADFDSSVLLQEDYENLYQQIENGALKIHTIRSDFELISIYNTLLAKKTDDGLDSLNEEERKVFNYINWMSLRRKGHLMIKAYKTKVLPRLTKIHTVQEQIELKNEDGDCITGIVDLVADIDGLGTFILDNKSSAAPYKDNSVDESTQLALYVHALEEKYKTQNAGYIVLNKKVKKNRVKTCTKCGHDSGAAKTCNNVINDKRCHGELDEVVTPEITVQIILSKISLQKQEDVLKVFDMANDKIKTKEFEPNENTCYNYFGKKCPYFSYCYNNDSTGLVDLNKKGKDNV